MPLRSIANSEKCSADSDSAEATGAAWLPVAVDTVPDYPSNFAVMEIFAFNTFDTGHPFSAASANF
jgi:hypothetical protein